MAPVADAVPRVASSRPGESVLGDRLRAHAGNHPNRIAVVAAGRLDYAELDRLSQALAQPMRDVADEHQHSAVLVGVADRDPSTLPRLVAALRLSLPVVVTTTAVGGEARRAVVAALTGRGLTALSWTPDGATSAEPPDGPRTGAALPPDALVLFTSGSTGRPRLVVDTGIRSAPARPAGARITARLGWRPGQRQLAVGPLGHASVLTFLVAGIADGNTVVVADGADPAGVLAAMEREQVEWAQLTPHQLRRLRLADPDGRADLSSLRALLHMSAACPAREKRFWHRRLGPTRLYEHFGSSEGLGATVARGDEWEARPGTVGRGFFTQLRILDVATGRPAAPGEVGEIWLRSSTARAAVYLDPAQRLRCSLDGFVTVGDRGRLDADGYLYPEPRQVGRIAVGGQTVLAGDVEEVLTEHPGVLDAAVGGVADDRFGQRVGALVVSAGEAPVPDSELRSWVRRQLPAAAVPRHLVRVDQVPRTVTGKADRDAVDARLREAVRTRAAAGEEHR